MSRMFSSLRAALLIPFVGVVILVAVSISLLSYQTGLKAVDELSEQLLLDISNRVTQATSRHLASSSVVLNAVAPDVAAAGNAPRHSDLVPDSLPQFEQRMWIAANLYPGNEGYIYYGSHKGEFVGLNRKADGDYELRWRELGTAQRTIYTTHGPGLRDAVLRTDNYDPRARPWFAEATQRGSLTWSSVYVDFTTRALTVTLAKPVFNQQRAQRGVVATDIPLTALTAFVRGLQVSRTGVAFIVERDGTLIMIDDERILKHLRPDEKIEKKFVRFRTLGCYPLTGAVESEAKTLPEVIQETLLTTTSERQGRAIDKDAGGAGMEKKKQEGYF